MCRHKLYAKQCDRPGSGSEGQPILNTKFVSWKWILAHQYCMLAAEDQRRLEWEVEAWQTVEQRTWGNYTQAFMNLHHTYMGEFYRLHSKSNRYVTNYNLYVTVCCVTPMLSFIVSIFLVSTSSCLLEKRKMTVSLLLSSFYISSLSLQEKEFQLHVNVPDSSPGDSTHSASIYWSRDGVSRSSITCKNTMI